MSRMLSAACVVLLTPNLIHAADAPVDFNRDIRPILSDKCFACHGPDEKQRTGGFRLDEKASALGKGESGEVIIVPGKATASELIKRITSKDDELRMPPADSTKSLTLEEIALITAWVSQGADWKEHWAFIGPLQAELPQVSQLAWCRNPIDRFVLAGHDREGLKPNAEASRETLLRCVTFDLTGLPPTLAEIDAFLADESPDAFEKVVDRLLKSEHFGEHMAHYWLDAARYGDTHGLHLDNYREIWAYRDWVVDAFNRNLPFDQFAIEQLAGDLLENPTDEQLTATGFNRCHVTTGEGGSIAEEVYVRNVVDRVVTTGTVFMGMTFDCSRCHDHKYDPFTQRDFYSMFAFFNSIDGAPLDGNKKDHAPVLKVTTREQKARIAELELKIAQARSEIARQLVDFKYIEPETPTETKVPEREEFVWIDDAVPEGAAAQGNTPWKFADTPKPVSGSKVSTRTAAGLSQHFFTAAKQPLRIAKDDVLFCHVWIDEKNPAKEIMLQWNDGTWEHRAYWGGNSIPWGKDGTVSRKRLGDLPAAGQWVRLEVPAADVGLKVGAAVNGWAFTQFDGTVSWDKAGIVSGVNQNPLYDSIIAWQRDQKAAGGASLPAEVKTIVLLEPGKRNPEQQKQLLDYFVENAHTASREIFNPLNKTIADAEKQVADVRNTATTTMIFREKKEPKPAHMLNRGEYDQPLEHVTRAVPGTLPSLPEGAPLNRLGFARWLVDDSHPLTARVTVNRLWQQCFGIGLVKTSEDFGSQGEPPSHPELLDWLAVQFREDGWDVKQMMKRIVMSATYRQSAASTRELRLRDPENRLLSRGPRFRLDAEMLRDQALAVSGLLNTQLGGPAVKPPQPDGLWFAVGYSGSNTVRVKADAGPENVQRRTLYTVLNRTAVAPQMSIIDAPSRESCSVRRERTNTPLQALLLLNDPQYFECARGLAERVLREGGDSVESRVNMMFRLCASRFPRTSESTEIVKALADMRTNFTERPEAAKRLVSVGTMPPDESLDVVELASWTVIANLILNLDEVLSKG